MVKTTESSNKSPKKTNALQPRTIIKYKLSDPSFIPLNWTKLAVIPQTISGVSIKPWSCFRKRDEEKKLFYPKGQLAAIFKTDGSGKVFYIDGLPAIELSDVFGDYQRIWLYSEQTANSESKLLGWLDSFGNCIICDLKGDVIANYDQMGGIIYTKEGYLKWRWDQLAFKTGKRGKKIHSHNKKERQSRDVLPKTSVSQLLLSLYVTNAPNNRSLRMLGRKMYFQCKINNSLSLWISGQDRVDLSFVSNSFITRLDVGVTIYRNENDSLEHSSTSNITPEQISKLSRTISSKPVKNPYP